MRRLSLMLVLVLSIGAALPPVAAVEAGPATAETLERCPGVPRARCGTVTVLIDPVDPAAGTIDIGFELHPARRGDAPSLGTIVASEGGPGYATTASRDSYLALFDPLLDRRDLLLVDNRGTGTSAPIDCAELQSYEGDYIANVGLCGQQLGTTSDLYGTGLAADDLVAVLDALAIAKVDLYGDSYGSFFAQAFAVRHPDRLRTLVLDGSYPVEDQDPWYRDLNQAMRDALRFVCERDPGCAALGGDPVARLAALADELRQKPLTGSAYDADGIRRTVTVDPGLLGYLAGVATYGFAVYRELDAAARAYLRPIRPDPLPLLRIAAEQIYWGDGGPVEEYSEGLYVAAICNDYPQLWDISAQFDARPAQFESALAELRRTTPEAFEPFTVDDWLASPWAEYQSCIRWPAPGNWVPPVEPGSEYPDVPTLVLAGDLDSITSPAGGRIVAGHFPRSTYIEVTNGVHIAALGDYSRCASDIVVRFVRSGGSTGDTSCAGGYNEVRVLEEFPARLQDVTPAPLGRVPSPVGNRRVTAAVANTVADVFPRWLSAFGSDGVGLRGGRFTSVGSDVVSFRLRNLQWVPGVKVSGTMEWNRFTGKIVARVRVHGRSGGNLVLRWNDYQPRASLRAKGRIEGRLVDLVMPAP